MKTAGMVLGIVGGAVGIVWSIFIIIMMGGFATRDVAQFNVTFNPGSIFIVLGAVGTLAGIMGLIGGLILKKYRVASGVLLIIAAVASLIAYFQFIAVTLFVIAAVFALMKQPAPAAPYTAMPPQQPQQPAIPENTDEQ